MPDRCVVDTDVLSYLLKQDTRSARHQSYLEGKIWIVSFMTVAELDLWALERRWGAARRAQVEAELNRLVIYPSDRQLCTIWAYIGHRARQQGRPIQSADTWIAATAMLLDVPLITNNARDFGAVEGLALNPHQQ